jgi:hypothetical protein
MKKTKSLFKHMHYKQNYVSTENPNQVIQSCRQPIDQNIITCNPTTNDIFLRKGEPNIISEPWEYSFGEQNTIIPALTTRHKMLTFSGAITYTQENTAQNTTNFYSATPQISLNTVYEFDSSHSKVDAIFEIEHSECDPTTGKSFTLRKHGDLHLRDIHVRDTLASRNITAPTIIADTIITNDISFSSTQTPTNITDEHLKNLIQTILNDNTTTATLQHLHAESIHATEITVDTLTTASDANLKENIQTIEKSDLETLRPVTYNYKKNYNKQKSYQKRYGLIAQEVELVYPDLVETHADTKQKSVNYIDIIALLVKDNQELREKIKNIEKKLNI